MRIFLSDLDNTIIYSYKRDIGNSKLTAEIYKGREISFITEHTYKALDFVNGKINFIPLTTRSIEQYKRISFNKIWSPKFALSSNGGTLLINGSEDMEYKRETFKIIEPFVEEMSEAENILINDSNRIIDVQRVDGLFVYTKSENPEETLKILENGLGEKGCGLRLFRNNQKIYAVPPPLNKGVALERVKNYLDCDFVISAGDSIFDVPMLNRADISFFPEHIREFIEKKDGIFSFKGNGVFSDYVLDKISSII